MMGELGGLLAVQLSSPRCNRLRLSQRQDGRLLPLLLLSLSLAETLRPRRWKSRLQSWQIFEKTRSNGRRSPSVREWRKESYAWVWMDFVGWTEGQVDSRPRCETAIETVVAIAGLKDEDDEETRQQQQ